MILLGKGPHLWPFLFEVLILKLILASTSPYRKELLNRLQIPFECEASHVDEEKFEQQINDPHLLTKTLAFEKAKSVFSNNRAALVIGGDQLSVVDNKILGKPHTFENACKQLRELSNRKHTLITSVCLMSQQNVIEFYDETILSMRDLSDAEIKDYVTKDNPLNCAGSYKIESLGISLFNSIDSKDFTAIMGLPLMQLSAYIRELNN